jgi:methylphosphotriester-DNA--protein-cysteine methyltransferase
MGKKPRQANDTLFDKARDELYSHVLRCKVMEAQREHRKDWFDDTMEYLGERYPTLTDEEMANLRQLGERYCEPVIPHGQTAGATT